MSQNNRLNPLEIGSICNDTGYVETFKIKSLNPLEIGLFVIFDRNLGVKEVRELIVSIPLKSGLFVILS